MTSRLTLPALSFGTHLMFNCDSASASSAWGLCFTHQHSAEGPRPTVLLCPTLFCLKSMLSWFPMSLAGSILAGEEHL